MVNVNPTNINLRAAAAAAAAIYARGIVGLTGSHDVQSGRLYDEISGSKWMRVGVGIFIRTGRARYLRTGTRVSVVVCE